MGKKKQKGHQQPTATKNNDNKTFSLDDVKTSTTELEFNKNKDALLSDLEDQISDINEEKEKLASEIKDLTDNRNKIKKEYEDALTLIRSASEEAQKTKEDAETKAKDILDDAQKQRVEIIAQAKENAKNFCKNKADDLEKQAEEIRSRESEIDKDKRKLASDRRDLDYQKEELNELQDHVKKLKEKYLASNPNRIEELNRDLEEETKKYNVLLERYHDLSKKYGSAQALLDTIKHEVENTNGGKKLVSVLEIVSSLGEIQSKYEQLASIYEKYPDDAHIADLEEKASRTTKLEIDNKKLEQERNRFREEAVAANSAKRELEVIRQEVEATNALNEHLLRELESHKTALESRTGDTCPALSKVDDETEETEFIECIHNRERKPPISSLKELVTHVKNYAGSRKNEEQLFYEENDIRAFLAGMAVSRLIILQGMSGTGKSSLPRIFSKAISGFHRLIPVESSWRDRNELLGYYNDFNKKFNAKSFTIELYRSSKKRCQDIPTFIVLDEMNLARIEYYFSDFLAILQEPDHEKWLIELVSSDMRTLPMEVPDDVKKKMKKEDPSIFAIWQKIEKAREGDLKSEISDDEKAKLTEYIGKLGKLTGAKDLIAGRKIRVTDNIWFVGTANKDESTFEISDKVYDRAQVVSLDKKGVYNGPYSDPHEKFISVENLLKLFETAINKFTKKDDVKKRLDIVDECLMNKFDVSFGNRIVTQTVNFVAVFCESGGTIEGALDYQISTKILRKILSSDNKEAFEELQKNTSDYPITQHQIQKRIIELSK